MLLHALQRLKNAGWRGYRKLTVLESFGLGGAGYHARDQYIVTDTIAPRLYLMTRMRQEVAQAK
jgi:glutamate carboxypeptidase